VIEKLRGLRLTKAAELVETADVRGWAARRKCPILMGF
jgi:hypothetical protein